MVLTIVENHEKCFCGVPLDAMTDGDGYVYVRCRCTGGAWQLLTPPTTIEKPPRNLDRTAPKKRCARCGGPSSGKWCSECGMALRQAKKRDRDRRAREREREQQGAA